MISKLTFTCLIFLLLGHFKSCVSYKGLLIMTMGTRSHVHFFGSVMDALTTKGHQMTFITPIKKPDLKNITHIPLKVDFTDLFLGNTFEISIPKMLSEMKKHSTEICIAAIQQSEVQKALEEKYDFIMLSTFFTDCFIGSAFEKKIPVIYLDPNVLLSPYSERFGAPEFYSISMNRMMPFTFPLSFGHRVINTLGNLFAYYLIETTMTRTEEEARKLKIWKPETPSIFEMQTIGSLAIINSVRALEYPKKSTPPNIIYAGGIHIKESKPLPKDLDDWLTESGDDGFILFALGTGVKSEHMNKIHIQSMLNVFRGLKQRIIWKFDPSEITESIPSNVQIRSWLPQQDILAHPNIKLFITHGGLLSTLEATYFSVPVVGMPVFGDQASNIADVVAQGWGLKLTWKELTEESFRSVLNEILTNQSYYQEASRRSKLMKDWPTNPKNEVSFWTEYVVRHKGAKHLQGSLALLPWYQAYNVDVWAFLISTLIGILIILVLLLLTCVKFVYKKFFKLKKE